jgi:hypothetical protein
MINDPSGINQIVANRALHNLLIKFKVNRLYAEQAMESAFFEKEKPIVRREFEKTGSSLILLGGKLTGKAIVRVIPKSALAAWKKALNAKKAWEQAGFDYIPVEPILKKKQKLRVSSLKSGDVRVSCKVLGPSLYGFLGIPENKKYSKDLIDQMMKIENVLTELGIEHGHLHRGNFCVEMHKNNKGQIKPRLYVIDFDRAELTR